jgi:hypothetical protein
MPTRLQPNPNFSTIFSAISMLFGSSVATPSVTTTCGNHLLLHLGLRSPPARFEGGTRIQADLYTHICYLHLGGRAQTTAHDLPESFRSNAAVPLAQGCLHLQELQIIVCHALLYIFVLHQFIACAIYIGKLFLYLVSGTANHYLFIFIFW